MSNVVITTPMQLFLDDVGWFWGWNHHVLGMPSRTGIPRRHVLADYIAINEIGRKLGMKICVAFCIGEWDRHNILRRVPNSNLLGENWDSAAYLDLAEAERIRDHLNTAEYVEIALHGLLHDQWHDGKWIGGEEYLLPKGYPETLKSDRHLLAPVDHIRKHLDAFFEIYDDWGFQKKIRAFASPGGAWDTWKDDSFTRILSEYGIRFWCNNDIGACLVSNDIIKNPKVTELVTWEAYGVDPRYFPTYPIEKLGIMGGHWPNILHFDPENNLDRVDAWKSFFDRNTAQFGAMQSKDIGSAHCQLVYKSHGRVIETENETVLDLTEADKLMPKDLTKTVFISSRRPLICMNADMSIYEQREDHIIYRIENRQHTVTLQTAEVNA